VVDLILEEIANIRRQTLGLTAEQIVSKLERDGNALAILKHLLSDTSPQQLERLLIEVLPARYLQVREEDDPFAESLPILKRFSRAYRVAFEVAPEDSKRKVLERFVRVLREEDGDVVTMYSSAFFQAPDLQFADPNHQTMI
jgi:hypothetical protein